MHQKLDLTDQEKNKISKLARHNKFENANLKMIYPENNFEKLKYFNKCCRFFINLNNIDIGTDIVNDDPDNSDSQVDTSSFKDIKKKIVSFSESIKGKYKESFILVETYDSEMEMMKNYVDIKIMNFIIGNNELIDYIIDKTHELGKQIKQYDPDTSQGYY